MTQPPTAPAAANRPSAPPTERVRLARLALDAALSMDGVESGTDGPMKLWVTVDQGQRHPGVVAAVLPDGRHQLTLHLVAAPVPLQPLADGIRARIEADATLAGLADRLGPVDVAFEDLADPNARTPPASPTGAPTPPASSTPFPAGAGATPAPPPAPARSSPGSDAAPPGGVGA